MALKGGHWNGAGWPFCLVCPAAGRGKAGEARAGSSWEPRLAGAEGRGPGQTPVGLVLCQDDWLWRRRCVAKTMFKTSRKMWSHFFSTGFRPSPPAPWVRVGHRASRGEKGRTSTQKRERGCGPGFAAALPLPLGPPLPPVPAPQPCIFPVRPGDGARTPFTDGQPRPVERGRF